MTSLRLLIFSNIIAPYRVELFNIVHATSEIDLHVAYLAKSESNRKWIVPKEKILYPFTILPGLHWRVSRDKTLHFNIGVQKLFTSFRPDVVFLGTDLLGSTASWLVLWFARRWKIPVIRYEARHAGTVNDSWFKNFAFKFLIKRVTHFFVYSRLTEKYLRERYGIQPQCITIGYNVGGSKNLILAVKSYRESVSYKQFRAELPKLVMLFVGQLDERKNILSILRSLREIEGRQDEDCCLFIAGDGPLRDQVLSEAATLQRTQVNFLGYLQNTELSRYYALADIFILPSLSDPASIALTEALHSGLFVIGSMLDGSSANYIIEGKNGFIVDPHDNNALSVAIDKSIKIVYSEPDELRKTRIANSVSDYTIESYAQRLTDVVFRLGKKNG